MDPLSLMIVIPAVLFGFAAIPISMLVAAKVIPNSKRKQLSLDGAIEMVGHKGVMVFNAKVFPMDIQSKVLSRFIEEFDQRFPAKRTMVDKLLGLKNLDKAKSNLVIEWVDGDYFWARDNNNVEFPEGHGWRGKVYGQFIGGYRVANAARNLSEPPKEIGSTAFIHELNHWALKVTTGNSDADHAQDNGHGDEWTGKHNEMISVLKKEFI